MNQLTVELALKIEAEVLAAWAGIKAQPMPLKEAKVLWRNSSGLIYVEDQWGPAIPYAPVCHEDGTQNHGYRSLKGDKASIAAIPEVVGLPEFQELLTAINRAESPIESVGCEKGYFPIEGGGDAKVSLAAYIDIIFSDLPKNSEPENFLRLAARLLAVLEGCEAWWGNVEFALQRLRKLKSCDGPWGLILRLTNAGRSEDEAKHFWNESACRLKGGIIELTQGFPEDMPINFAAVRDRDDGQ